MKHRNREKSARAGRKSRIAPAEHGPSDPVDQVSFYYSAKRRKEEEARYRQIQQEGYPPRDQEGAWRSGGGGRVPDDEFFAANPSLRYRVSRATQREIRDSDNDYFQSIWGSELGLRLARRGDGLGPAVFIVFGYPKDKSSVFSACTDEFLERVWQTLLRRGHPPRKVEGQPC